MNTTIVYVLAAAAVIYLIFRIRVRLQLSAAKHPSLRGHAKMARRFARLVPFYAYRAEDVFAVDRAPQEVEQKRRAGFERLEALYRSRFPKSVAATEAVKPFISDAQFTAHYRVPFQFSRFVHERLKAGSFMKASRGVTLTDLDDNEFYDLAGSYGVNVFGHDFYKECIEAANEQVRDLGPVLGAYHPVIADNVQTLRAVSGLDEVSFHMSGTEAVMQAVRLARYHTSRSKLVRFCGAYHGWWGDVQPGVGNPQTMRDTYTLKDMSEASLQVLRTRKDIACVLINPLQALHPNANAPSDSTLLASDREGGFDKATYKAWLEKVRAVCTARGIVLIFDEVFVGFRLAWGGAQQYFGINADMVTYGKTLGGGLPVGVVCGQARYMKRFRDNRPADVCFARGTFNSHPYVMAAMNAFLTRVNTPEYKEQYARIDEIWDGRAQALNDRLDKEGIPVAVANMASIFTVRYTKPSRYNWLLQYYLRAEGLALSWVGTGRFIFSHNYTDEDFEAVIQRFVAACKAMEADGFWWAPAALTNKSIKRQIVREMIRGRRTGVA